MGKAGREVRPVVKRDVRVEVGKVVEREVVERDVWPVVEREARPVGEKEVWLEVGKVVEREVRGEEE